MDVKSLTAIWMTILVCIVIIVSIYFFTVGQGWVSEYRFGGSGGKVSAWTKFFYTKHQYLLMGLYFLSLLSIFIYRFINGVFQPILFVGFYLYTAIITYIIVYLDYKHQIKRFLGSLKFFSALVFSLIVLYSKVIIDLNLYRMTTLPAASFPTSQTVLVFLIAPLYFTALFFIITYVFYLYHVLIILYEMFFPKKITVTNILYRGMVIVALMFLSVGVLRIFTDVFGEDYNLFYAETFVDYSYHLNGKTCTNIDSTLYVSILSSGGVSVAYKKSFGDYYFSTDECIRETGNYPKIYM